MVTYVSSARPKGVASIYGNSYLGKHRILVARDLDYLDDNG